MARQLRALDLFAGEGGVTKGLQRAGFHVTAVDNDPARLRLNPGDVVIEADAMEYLVQHGHDYDYVHASPTCTGYCRGTSAVADRLSRYPRLIGAVRELLTHPEVLPPGTPWTLENVEDAKRELTAPVMLCWTMFRRPGAVIDDDGTPLWMRRHRLFDSNVPLMSAGGCDHPTGMQCAGAYGGARRDKHEAKDVRHGGYVPSLTVMRRLLDTPWMSEKGCQLSIPPAYAEYVAEQVSAYLCDPVGL